MIGRSTIATAEVTPLFGADEIAFCAWVAQAVPGDRLEYYRGFLAVDVWPLFTRLTDPERDELTKLAARALWAAEQGLVHLVQERLLGRAHFAYLAIARPKPNTADFSLSSLLLDAA